MTPTRFGPFRCLLPAALAAALAVTPCLAGDATEQPFRMGQGAPGQAGGDPRKLEQINELYEVAQHMRAIAAELEDRADDLRDRGKYNLAQRQDDKADSMEEQAGQIEDQAATLEAELREKTSGHSAPHRPSAPASAGSHD